MSALFAIFLQCILFILFANHWSAYRASNELIDFYGKVTEKGL